MARKSGGKEKKTTGRSVRRVLVNLFVIFFVVVYLWLLGPAVKFMNNRLPESDKEILIEVDKGDDVLNMDELVPDPTDAPTETPSPEPTPEFIDPNDPSGNASSGSDSSSVPYVPDPIVPGVKKANGSQIKLEADARNILVLGVDEGSGGLTDTIVIISICDRTGEVQVLSLARDAYVPYSGAIKSVIEGSYLKNSAGVYKLNATMFIGNHIKYTGGKFGNSGIDFLCHVLREMMPNANMDIDDYIYVRESAFAGFIDVFGGVDVYISEDIYSGSGDAIGLLLYEKGLHHLSGDEAYFYVSMRGRNGPNGPISSSGNPYRMANQLGFIRDCANDIVTIDNIDKIPELFTAATRYINHSFTMDEILTDYTGRALKYAKGGYSMQLTVVSGSSIVPPGVIPASYVNLMA